MQTLVVVRVVYVDDTARSVSVPCEPFTGDCAQVNAAAYVRNLLAGKKIGGPNRTEYHVLPAGIVAGGSLNLTAWSPTKSSRSPDEDETGIRLRVPTKKFGAAR